MVMAGIIVFLVLKEMLLSFTIKCVGNFFFFKVEEESFILVYGEFLKITLGY